MEKIEDVKKENKKFFNPKFWKPKFQIIIPVIIAVIIVAVAFYIDYQNRKSEPEEPMPSDEPVLLLPISPEENPRRQEELGDLSFYGCASPGTIEPKIIKEQNKEWLIKRNGDATTISLGKYRITNPFRTIVGFPKIWLYFFSDKLSEREDGLYGLEKSYVSGITLMVNGSQRRLKLGGDEYMFVELDDYPFGDLYPFDKLYGIDFEFLIELKCQNVDNGKCLDNGGKELKYLDGADIVPQIRIFAFGCEEFTHDIEIDSKFKYGD